MIAEDLVNFVQCKVEDNGGLCQKQIIEFVGWKFIVFCFKDLFLLSLKNNLSDVIL